MRGHGTKTGERSARHTDQMVFDREDGFRDDGEPALEEKVVDAHDRTGQRVFDGREKCVGGALIDGAEGSVKRGAGHSRNGIAEKLNGGSLAESAGFALKSHAHGLAIGCAHRQALSCNKGRKTKSKDSLYNPSSRKRIHHEQTGGDGVRGILCELHLKGPGVRRIERFGIATFANAAVVRRTKRAGRKLPVCAGKMDGQGSSRTHHGYRTHFCLPGLAVRARRSDAAPRL